MLDNTINLKAASASAASAASAALFGQPLAVVLLAFAGACGVAPTLLGLFTFWHLLRPKKAPVDASNRINHIRLWWFALTREDLFVDLFPWLKRDELDNTKNQQH